MRKSPQRASASLYSAATNLPYNRVYKFYKAIATMRAAIIFITHLKPSEMNNSVEKSKNLLQQNNTTRIPKPQARNTKP